MELKQKIKDCLILFKFRVWTLLIFVGIFSYLLATKSNYEFNLIVFIFLFLAGSLSIMGNGALNNYFEIDVDKRMNRTKNRPLVKGNISRKFALYSGIILIILGIVLAIVFINLLTAFFILLATIIYLIYTIYLKQNSTSNVLIGGFAGSCTAWGGWAAATNSLHLFGFLLGILVYIWTNPHIWALAMKYKEDYNNAGIKMLTALTDEKHAAKIIVISSLPLPIITLILALLGKFSIYFLSLSIFLNILFLTIAIWIFINPSINKGWILFKISSPYLALIFLAMYIDPNPLNVI